MDRLPMEPDVKTMGNIFEIVSRRKRSILLPAVGIFLLSAAFAFLLPKKYQSTATIFIEEQEVPREYVPSNITTFADQRLQAINQRIMSTTRLLELIGRFGLYGDMKDRMPVDEIVARMRKDIQFSTISADVADPRTGRPAQATIAFALTYEGRDPETVQRVAGELASLYLRENLKTREKGPLETSTSTEEEMKAAQGQPAEPDPKVAHGLEKEPLGGRFSIVDAARLPEKPSGPNVPAILLIGLILGMGGGVGLAAFQESADQTVRSAEALQRGTAFLVLASIPEIVTPEDLLGARSRRRYVGVGVLFFLAAAVLAFSLFVLDLDMLLAKVIRRFFL